MIFRAEEAPDGRWNACIDAYRVATGPSRASVIASARRTHRVMMDPVPLQPEEIPDELREIAKRMRAVGDAVASHKVYQPYHPTAAAMGRWADSVADWATNLEECAK